MVGWFDGVEIGAPLQGLPRSGRVTQGWYRTGFQPFGTRCVRPGPVLALRNGAEQVFFGCVIVQKSGPFRGQKIALAFAALGSPGPFRSLPAPSRHLEATKRPVTADPARHGQFKILTSV
jgi:hypothetical protein